MERCQGHVWLLGPHIRACWVTQSRWPRPRINSDRTPPPPAPARGLPSTAQACLVMCYPSPCPARTPRHAHLSFLRSPRATGLTAILGSVEAEAWDWLQEDRVSMLRGDCGGVLHSECDNEPAKKGGDNAGLHLASQLSSSQDPEGDMIQTHGPMPRPQLVALASDAGSTRPVHPHITRLSWTQCLQTGWTEEAVTALPRHSTEGTVSTAGEGRAGKASPLSEPTTDRGYLGVDGILMRSALNCKLLEDPVFHSGQSFRPESKHHPHPSVAVTKCKAGPSH